MSDGWQDGYERAMEDLKADRDRWEKHANDLGDLLAKREDEIARLRAEPPSTSVPCDHIVKAGWFGDTPLTKIRGAKFCVECGAALDGEGV